MAEKAMAHNRMIQVIGASTKRTKVMLFSRLEPDSPDLELSSAIDTKHMLTIHTNTTITTIKNAVIV